MNINIIDESILSRIAQCIRDRKNTTDLLTPGEMPEKIMTINENSDFITLCNFLEGSIETISLTRNVYNGCFNGCASLVSVEFPDGITEIKESVFSGCSKLQLTKLPSTIKYIHKFAFYSCAKMELTELPSSLWYIYSCAFGSCKKLAITKIPESVKYIDTQAFEYCTGLTTLTFEGTPSYIGRTAFTGCTNLITINVPWAEGKVANAPWGATNATINYNYNPTT